MDFSCDFFLELQLPLPIGGPGLRRMSILRITFVAIIRACFSFAESKEL